MKNKKLNLNELKVKSFVTDLENGKEHTFKGGASNLTICMTWCCATHIQNTWCACEPQ